MTTYFSYRKLYVGISAIAIAILFSLVVLTQSNKPPLPISSTLVHTQTASSVRLQSGTSVTPITSTQKETTILQRDIHSVQTPTKNTQIQDSASLLHSTIRKLYYVTRVVDGDTLIASMNGQSVRVRLLGINTPETVDPRKPVECFGKEASERAKALLTGTWVYLETDPTQSTYDRYGRLLAYVFLKDGTNFDKQMIQNGYGYEYTYRHREYRYQKEFRQAQQYAQIHKLGLWALGVCEAKKSV